MTIKVRKEVGEINMIGIWGKAGKAVKKKQQNHHSILLLETVGRWKF